MSLALIPFNELQEMGSALARSGLFGMKTPDQAIALMLVAQAEGQHPATIAQDYDIIQGKATRKTHSVLARYQKAGGRVEWHQLTDQVAEATFTHPQGGSVRLDWTMAQAKAAGLAGKDNWKNYARAMLRARLIAEGVRATFPAALGGMMVSEEAQDLPAEQFTPAPPPPPKDMGNAEEVLPWPAELFAKRLPEWRAAIAAKKATADSIVGKAKTKHPLTKEQEAAIRTPIAEKLPPLSYAEVADALTSASTPEERGLAHEKIQRVADEKQREELTAMHADIIAEPAQ